MKNFVITSVCVAAAALLQAGCATPLVVALDHPGNAESEAMVVAARGTQIYQCRANGQAGHGWTFVAPQAELFDSLGRLIGNHGAGPHWQAFDGSRFTGSVKAQVDSPIAGAVPWLLITTRSEGRKGLFDNITSVQRLNTSGGIAPTAACSIANAGDVARVPYAAEYRLFSDTAGTAGLRTLVAAQRINNR